MGPEPILAEAPAVDPLDGLPDDLTPEELKELGLDPPSSAPHATPAPSSSPGEPAEAELATTLSGTEEVESSQGLMDFFDAWDLYADPALTALAAGAMLGALGVYIVMRNMVFLTAAASQVASLGVVLAHVLPVITLASLGVALDPFMGSPLLGAFVFTAAATLWVATGNSTGERTRDTALGLVFIAGSAGTMALGGMGAMDGADLHDVQALLLGSAVAVEPDAAVTMWWVAAVILGLHVVAWRGFREVTADPMAARVSQLPVKRLELVLWLSVALAIALSTRTLGALPTFAYAVIPAWAAMRVAPNHPWAMVLAATVGAVAGFGGYVVAFVADMPPEAIQPLTATVLALSLIVGHALVKRLRPKATPGA